MASETFGDFSDSDVYKKYGRQDYHNWLENINSLTNNTWLYITTLVVGVLAVIGLQEYKTFTPGMISSIFFSMLLSYFCGVVYSRSVLKETSVLLEIHGNDYHRATKSLIEFDNDKKKLIWNHFTNSFVTFLLVIGVSIGTGAYMTYTDGNLLLGLQGGLTLFQICMFIHSAMIFLVGVFHITEL